jgi:hypothetical protein
MQLLLLLLKTFLTRVDVVLMRDDVLTIVAPVHVHALLLHACIPAELRNLKMFTTLSGALCMLGLDATRLYEILYKVNQQPV